MSCIHFYYDVQNLQSYSYVLSGNKWDTGKQKPITNLPSINLYRNLQFTIPQACIHIKTRGSLKSSKPGNMNPGQLNPHLWVRIGAVLLEFPHCSNVHYQLRNHGLNYLLDQRQQRGSDSASTWHTLDLLGQDRK